jgi:NADP-dependent 3-hydroxy acid dehydrogenase YdfG
MEIRTEGVYIITGATGGVAGAVAEVFHGAGARLALVGRTEATVRERAGRIGALPLVADLTSLDEAQRAVDETRRALGHVDGLIHTAGGFEMAPADTADAGHYDRLFDVNVRTLFCAVRAVLPGLLAQGDGFIAGFSTGAVWSGATGPGMAIYAAAKAAVSMYLRSIEREVRHRGIRVAVVYPIGAIDTPQNRRDMPAADVSTWIDPAEIGAALLFASTRGPRGRLLELPIGARA